MSMPELNFFTTALGKHSIFAFPYIMACLLSNKNCVVELIVDNINVLTYPQRKFLNSIFKHKWLAYQRNHKMINWGQEHNWTSIPKLASIRWLSIPKIKSTYTYISDVDILTLESNIAYEHSEHAKFLELAYSNIIRHPAHRITGCHFVVSNDWYKVINKQYCNNIIDRINNNEVTDLDENLLYKLAEKIGLPNITKLSAKDNVNSKPYYNIFYRPIHGIHMSLNRPALVGWGVTKIRYNQYLFLQKNNVWKSALKLFSSEYLNEYNKIPLAFKKHTEYINSNVKIIKNKNA